MRKRPDGEQSVDIFTDADWDNLMKGYTSQYVEHDFWVEDSMVEGVCCTSKLVYAPDPNLVLASSLPKLCLNISECMHA